MSTHTPTTVKMSKVKFRSVLNFARIHQENCNGKFKKDENYHGSAMQKSWCTKCGAVGFIVRETEKKQTFEGYLPLSFVGSLRLSDESQFRTFSCKECGETLDQPVNNSTTVCPVCGTNQFKPTFRFSGNEPIITQRARIS
jgi:rubrerythrin